MRHFIINESNGVLVPIISITVKYITPNNILGISFLLLNIIINIIGVSIDIIPLTSLAELKKPNVPAFVISYDLYPILNNVGININIKYKNTVVNKVNLDILISSLILYKAINTIGK